jgi:geranylgeranyl diphosphate synthase type II
MNWETFEKAALQRVDQSLEHWLPPESEEPETIHRAMRYSMFAGGKRIRPLLTMAAAEAVRAGCEGAEHVGAAVEMIHTYSLIHDDLPALDNDDLRRGRPTNHKVFGEAMAILAGDSLLTRAFQVLSELPGATDCVRLRLVRELAIAAGTVGGMIAGQVLDMEGGGTTPTPELLHKIHHAKTGALLRASVRMGAIYAGATDAQLAAITAYGEHAGFAFQIVDDILDVEASSEALGKTAGKDAAQAKITFPAVYGLEASRQMARREYDAALATLLPLGDGALFLRHIAQRIVERSS